MAEPVTQPKTWDPAQDSRGLECRYCGYRHFRVIYMRRGWASKLIRSRERWQCGKQMTTWERPIGALAKARSLSPGCSNAPAENEQELREGLWY